ncbi:hypothetical protein BR93DRAFT_593260 [Coniochaeta sp. PMI_546]|nr:hypothetical protein BR93DRAFT_593260 [Coniochaeta sp. PMI_546]
MQHHSHHPQHQPGQGPPHHLHRPSSIVHQQQHHPQAQSQQQHPGYPSSHPVYQEQSQVGSAQHGSQLPYYAQSSSYSTPGASSAYTTSDTSDMIATTMQRPTYPPMSYHTPQSNSPASVNSPSGHDQQRSIYGQPAQHMHQPSLYYGGPAQSQYPSITAQTAPSPYGQHAQPPQQSMTSQPNMMMSHTNPQHHLAHQASQHAQAGMAGSPRHTKIEAHSMKIEPHTMTPQMAQRAPAPGSLGVGTPSQSSQNGTALSTPTGSNAGANPNAAPGPIPATTPLVVRQDQNGVQWIAFEYSRDRVKMEYTIRCDVESVNTDELSQDFKTENCVYPRACCPKENYRGNRLQYETECNTVGWALAQLNPPLRQKRGLIQRAVDSWRNSNQDPRLRSRRVRRMAKMNNRKNVQASPHPSHMPGVNGQQGMPAPGAMGPGGAPAMGKPGMNGMGHMQHHQGHHDGNTQGGGDEVDDVYMDDDTHHHHHAPSGARANSHGQAYADYGATYNRATPTASGHEQRRASTASINASDARNDIPGLFPPQDLLAKNRKFILVQDPERLDKDAKVRIRVTLNGVDTREIPDSFRKSASVFERSYFPREMQSPPPSPTGSTFFANDLGSAPDDDGGVQTDGRGLASSRRDRLVVMVKVPLPNGDETELPVPRTKKAFREKEVRINDLGYRLSWLQSRTFHQRKTYLQKALDGYRSRIASDLTGHRDIRSVAPHFEVRAGKRRWNDRMEKSERRND